MSALLSSPFDAASNRTRLAATIGASADFVTEFSYDNLQRLTGIQQHGVSGGSAVADKRIDLAYNAAGQFSAISRFADLAGTQAVATSDFVYDGTGRLIALTHAQGTSTLADYTWSFDAGNRLTQFTSLHDGIADYSYDNRGQLTGSQYDYQDDESYSYDANGNRTNSGYSTGDNNQLLSDGVHTYQYDAEGNRTKKTEIASGEATEYRWDHRNRLVSVVHRDALGVPLQTVDYVYDLFDRRIGKSDTPAGGPSEAEVYVYDGAHVALRFIDGQLANRYLHGPAIDQILADEQVDSLSSPGEILCPLTDHLGTVRDLAAYDDATSTTSIANHIAYDAFGRVTAQSNAAVDHLFGYTGREWDSAVDLQYNRARWYDPAIGRWLSEDPIGFAAGDANLSRYVGNRPVNAMDPFGLEEQALSPEEINSLITFRPNPFIGTQGNPLATHGNGLPAGSGASWHREAAQFRLDYLRQVLRNMLALGDSLANNPDLLDRCDSMFGSFSESEWMRLREHIEYALQYDRIGASGVWLVDGDSINLPGPGFSFGQDMFYSSNPYLALMILIHEPMHDMNRFGFGHDFPRAHLFSFGFGETINNVVEPYNQDNYFSRWHEFLQYTTYGGGDETLWHNVLRPHSNPAPLPQGAR